MRKYAALWQQDVSRAFVIYNDYPDSEWYVYTEVVDMDVARKIAESMNQ